MKLQSNFRNRWAGLLACAGMALMLGISAPSAKADQWNKKTIMTTNQPIQVTDTYLEPGTYVFRLLDSQSDRHIVQIYNANENHLIATVMAIPDYRVQVTSKTVFRMWETPAGYAAALRSWFYPGDNFGQQFRYPKNLRQIAFNQTAQTVTPPPVIETQPAPAQAEVTPEPQPEQNEIAQNTPPPPPPAVEEPAPSPAPAPTPTTLPQTASPYPLIGLIGALLIGLGGLLRQTRST